MISPACALNPSDVIEQNLTVCFVGDIGSAECEWANFIKHVFNFKILAEVHA